MQSFSPPRSLGADRQVLFGVLALQADLLDTEPASAEGAAPTKAQALGLAELLGERGWLTPKGRLEFGRLLERRLAVYGGDVRAGLAELSDRFLRRTRTALNGPDLAPASKGAAAAGLPRLPWTTRLGDRLRRGRGLVNVAATAVAVAVVGLALGMLLFPSAHDEPSAAPSYPTTPPGPASLPNPSDESDWAAERTYAATLQHAQQAWLEAKPERVLDLLEGQRPRASGEPDLRGFEWHYLWHLSQTQRLLLKGHAGVVPGLAFSPDGRRLASAGHDGSVKVHRLDSGEEVLALVGYPALVHGVAYSPEGRLLATAHGDGTVKIWEAATGKPLRSIRAHTNEVSGLAFSPDGRRLATAGKLDRTLKLWEAATGRCLSGNAFVDQVWCVAYSPDGAHLATGNGAGEVRVSPTTGARPLHLHAHEGAVQCLVFSPDGQRLASAGADRTVCVTQVDTGREVFRLRAHDGPVHGLAFSPDGRRLASAGADGTLKLWEAKSAREVLTLRGGSFRAVAFSPDGRALAAADADGLVTVWEADPPASGPTVQREARALVKVLFQRLSDKADVAESLRRDATLGEPLRKEALAQAERYLEDPEKLNEVSWAVVRAPNRTEAAYQRALHQATEASRQRPSDGYILNTLGVAQYRVGRYAEALETLTRSDRLNTRHLDSPVPADLAFLVMAHHRLGHKDRAEADLARLRQAMEQTRWRNDLESQDFLREVEELLGLRRSRIRMGARAL